MLLKVVVSHALEGGEGNKGPLASGSIFEVGPYYRQVENTGGLLSGLSAAYDFSILFIILHLHLSHLCCANPSKTQTRGINNYFTTISMELGWINLDTEIYLSDACKHQIAQISNRKATDCTPKHQIQFSIVRPVW